MNTVYFSTTFGPLTEIPAGSWTFVTDEDEFGQAVPQGEPGAVSFGTITMYSIGGGYWINGIPSGDYVILIAHNPSLISEIQQTRDSSGNLSWFDLGLFGHTHGGQMVLFSGLLGIADDVPDRYTSGWFNENRVDLLVSRGVGTSVFPARLFCPPQIHLIEVTN